ncbi:MAG: adenosylcobinamide amidohydrolase [Acidaminococcaceae bacterium]|nr:adenosylcobinamide amidohydrolase [Acidaminococcaceae bacterium]
MSKDTVTEKLYTLSTGDEVYRYDKSITIFFKGKRKVLSTSVFNGGYHENYTAVFNHDAKQGSGMPCEMLAPTYTEHMQILSRRLGLDPDMVTGMGTAADMENAAIETLSYENLTVTAIVTGGIETNGGRVGDPATFFKPLEKPDRAGTINIMLVLDTDMPQGTLARALVTCTEAKTAAIQELLEGSKYSNGIATGSGTDTTIVVANSESPLYLEGAGKHSKLGELIGRTVKQAVKEALRKQSGLCPTLQHNALKRLQRFGVTKATLWEKYLASKKLQYAVQQGKPAGQDMVPDKEIKPRTGINSGDGPIREKILLKPEFLANAEALAKEDAMLTYTSLYVHLLDQFLWGLLQKEETKKGAESMLRLLAEGYHCEPVEIKEKISPDALTAAWQQLFLKILDLRGRE